MEHTALQLQTAICSWCRSTADS